MEGDVVLWAGTPGIGKSQSMNKVLLDLLPKLQEGSLRAVFFRIDERLFKLSVDKDKSPSVKHVNCGESYEEQAKCVGQSMGTKYDGWPTKPMTDVVFVADAYANEHMKLEKFSCGTLIISRINT